jgi:hypothetical protein
LRQNAWVKPCDRRAAILSASERVTLADVWVESRRKRSDEACRCCFRRLDDPGGCGVTLFDAGRPDGAIVYTGETLGGGMTAAGVSASAEAANTAGVMGDGATSPVPPPPNATGAWYEFITDFATTAVISTAPITALMNIGMYLVVQRVKHGRNRIDGACHVTTRWETKGSEGVGGSNGRLVDVQEFKVHVLRRMVTV